MQTCLSFSSGGQVSLSRAPPSAASSAASCKAPPSSAPPRAVSSASRKLSRAAPQLEPRKKAVEAIRERPVDGNTLADNVLTNNVQPVLTASNLGVDSRAVWSQLRNQHILGINTSSGRCANLADMRREEEKLLRLSCERVANGSNAKKPAHPESERVVNVSNARKPGHPEKEAGWRRLPGGGSAYVTASGKRLSGKAAFAASSRQKTGK